MTATLTRRLLPAVVLTALAAGPADRPHPDRRPGASPEAERAARSDPARGRGRFCGATAAEAEE